MKQITKIFTKKVILLRYLMSFKRHCLENNFEPQIYRQNLPSEIFSTNMIFRIYCKTYYMNLTHVTLLKKFIFIVI